MGEMINRVSMILRRRLSHLTESEAESIVREILAAMREPTKAMIAATAGNLGGYGYGDDCFEADAVDVWQAMIDEALKNGPVAP